MDHLFKIQVLSPYEFILMEQESETTKCRKSNFYKILDTITHGRL